MPGGGSGEVGGRVAASRCICEVMAREMAAEAALTGRVGRERVAGRSGAGSLVRRKCAVCGRPPGAVGATGPGRTLAGRWIPPPGGGGALAGGRAEPPVASGGIEPDAVGPRVSRTCPDGGCPATRDVRGGTAPVAGEGSGPERGSSVTRGTWLVGAFGKSGRCGCGGVTSSGMGSEGG